MPSAGTTVINKNKQLLLSTPKKLAPVFDGESLIPQKLQIKTIKQHPKERTILTTWLKHRITTDHKLNYSSLEVKQD